MGTSMSYCVAISPDANIYTRDLVRTVISEKIDICTNELLLEANWSDNLEVCDLISRTEKGYASCS
jgi:hypothetical protein